MTLHVLPSWSCLALAHLLRLSCVQQVVSPVAPYWRKLLKKLDIVVVCWKYIWVSMYLFNHYSSSKFSTGTVYSRPQYGDIHRGSAVKFAKRDGELQGWWCAGTALYTRKGSNRENPQSTIMYRIQNIHTHSNGTTAPSRKSFPAHFAMLW